MFERMQVSQQERECKYVNATGDMIIINFDGDDQKVLLPVWIFYMAHNM